MLKSLVDKKTLNHILGETVSPRLEINNFKWNNENLWYTESINSIRHVFEYKKLKGEQGTFSWGVCLDFVPTFSRNKIKFHRTEKSLTLHLFEWTDEYSNSFFGGQLADGVTTHWGERETIVSISRLFDKYEKKIFDWYNAASSLDSLIQIATHQSQSERSYRLHWPNPDFILSFLLARSGQIDKALFTFDKLVGLGETAAIRDMLRQELKKSGT